MFQPPAFLLELIGFKKTRMEITLPTFDDSGDYAYVMAAMTYALEEFYGLTFGKKRKLNVQLVIGEIFLDAIINAARHGNKKNPNKKVLFGCWFGENGILFGFRDEGKFYSKWKIKELVESRTHILSTDPEGCNAGMEHIYQADSIHVSTTENTLYVVVMIETMILKR